MNDKILIRTLDVYNGNYGGVMQAFALQRVIDSLGFEAWTDRSYPVGATGRLKQLAKPLVTRLAPRGVVPIRLAAPVLNRELDSFVDRHIRTVDLYGGRRAPRRALLETYQGFVVGSDQVWRHAYADIPSYLLDFAADLPVPRVAYAASFGLDGLDGYDADLLELSRGLANQLSAVSVRESSGVEICRTSWGLDAVQVLDPTMLLTKEDYAALVPSTSPGDDTGPTVFKFTLDDDPEKRALTADIAASLGASVNQFMPPSPTSYREVLDDPGTYRKAPVGEWLRGFAEADFVVTDSFHGTVFSLIFEKPFVAVVNPSRGAARFTSLLDSFGLANRLHVNGARAASVNEPIDWSKVRHVLEGERVRSTAFLRTALGREQ